MAAQNEKYANIVKLHNFGLMFRVLSGWGLEVLRPYTDIASQEFTNAMEQHIGFMISSTFPSLAIVAKRIDGVGARVKQEELALYVRRYRTIQYKTIENNTKQYFHFYCVFVCLFACLLSCLLGCLIVFVFVLFL